MSESIKFLAWDSDFFKLKTGRIDLVSDSSLACLLRNAVQADYQLLYISSVKPLEAIDQDIFTVQDVGGRVDYLIETNPGIFLSSNEQSQVQEYVGRLNPSILNLAYLSGCFSRFRIDDRLPVDSFYHLYATWINQELINRSVYSVYTYNVEDAIVGMLTVKWSDNECTISLLSVDPKYQGRGIGSSLIHHLFSVCCIKGCSLIRVSTQISNKAARCLYEKCSFKVSNVSYVYHLHQRTTRN